MRVNKRNIRIEWGDCDPANIVYYPRYFEMFDACTQGLFAAVGLKKHDIQQRYGIVGIPMVDTRGKFIMPSTYGDEIVVETQVTRFGKSSFDVHHRVTKGEQLAAEGFETRVWTGFDGGSPPRMKAVPIPREVIDLLSGE